MILAMSPSRDVALAVAVVLALALALLSQRILNLWILAKATGAGVPFMDIVGMRLRKTDARAVIFARIRLRKAGIEVSTRELEAHALKGGDLAWVANAVIETHRDGTPVSFSGACAADLESRKPPGPG